MSWLLVDVDRLSELVYRLDRCQAQLMAACADRDRRISGTRRLLGIR